MARRIRTVALAASLLAIAAPAAHALAVGGDSQIGPERVCTADTLCATTHHPSVCWHGGRYDGAVCFSFFAP